jgi:hypothetical protein
MNLFSLILIASKIVEKQEGRMAQFMPNYAYSIKLSHKNAQNIDKSFQST